MRNESESDRDFRSRERNAGVESSERRAAARIARLTNRSAGLFTPADFRKQITEQVFSAPVQDRLKRAGLVGPIGTAAGIQWEADARRSTPNVMR